MSLSALRVTVAVFPGSNCDRDMMVAIEKLAGRRPSLVWHKESSLAAPLPRARRSWRLFWTTPHAVAR